MSALYLFRHAQAGPRHQYDTLSELGRRQAQALADYLVAQKTRFQAVYCGELERQQLTASAVGAAYRRAGVDFPDVVSDPAWNEFDLGAAYAALAPALAREDRRFEQEYQEMVRVMEDAEHSIHRNHSYCDIAIVRAWTANRYPYDGESWNAFRARVLTRVEALSAYEPGQKIAVFTSATPIGVWMGQALGIGVQEIWRLAGATYNTGMTTFQIRDQDLRLFTFNSLPHLPDPELWTFR